jgi:hypothetical protein
MRCQRCGNDVPANSRFCPNCGMALEAVASTPSVPGSIEGMNAPSGGSGFLWERASAEAPTPSPDTAAPSASPTAGSASGVTAVALADVSFPSSGRTRTRRTRPPTVPLAQFGKEPPPPPRLILTPRRLTLYVGITVLVLGVLFMGLMQLAAASQAEWSQLRCLDLRVKC